MKDVYTLADLDDQATLNPEGTKPAKLAVIGHPVAHSQSPQLHQPALDALDIDARYIRLDLEPGELPAAFAKMKELGFVGTNVTVPHKFEALSACTDLDPAAEALGAVNTVLFGDGEDLLGFNTDGPGFVRAIREEFSVDVRDLRIMIVGAGGGAGQALATQCAREGCEQLVLVNRSLEKLETLATRLEPYFESEKLNGPGERLEIYALDSPHLPEIAGHCDLLVQTTSLGLKATDPAPIPSSCLQPHHLVYDTIYQPARTKFLRNAEANGARIANGLSLLLHQGALSFEYWFPGTSPLDAMRKGRS
ncbi:shikimate dehydrogenase [Roseibacillus persicicus]|uniref:Shikimate dehydrogenase (NADP(+)) n=1 Tax=Roseibacillus persicicus TaxID=454148 RepID=A0A918TYQ0_9BACT|nr:shikimate dehydrogenase [Roseibacillus persicicus]GHC64908.1 shikimate dehydrogenase (NADP(+)) [Roseibacillus persicicus]